MILFDATNLEDSDGPISSPPPTPRVHVPEVLRIPIEWDVSDVLGDLAPPTLRILPHCRPQR